jgi:hypothetical protein
MKNGFLRKPIFAVALGSTLAFAAGYALAAQPHMQAALKALHNANADLQEAVPDKAGHRVKAMQLVTDAIAEVQAGIAAGQ